MEKIIQFKTKEPSYDIITDTAGSLPADVFGRYNIILTASLSADAKENAGLFRPSLEAGRDILYICRSGLENAKEEAGRLMAEYPGRNIICVSMSSDSENDCLKSVKMSRLRAAGATLKEAAYYYENHRHPSPVSFQNGRCSWPVATAISM